MHKDDHDRLAEEAYTALEEGRLLHRRFETLSVDALAAWYRWDAVMWSQNPDPAPQALFWAVVAEREAMRIKAVEVEKQGMTLLAQWADDEERMGADECSG